ncbi:hypothetical protein SALBM217S_09591 [Streptomyces griseoloalbus]
MPSSPWKRYSSTSLRMVTGAITIGRTGRFPRRASAGRGWSTKRTSNRAAPRRPSCSATVSMGTWAPLYASRQVSRTAWSASRTVRAPVVSVRRASMVARGPMAPGAWWRARVAMGDPTVMSECPAVRASVR